MDNVFLWKYVSLEILWASSWMFFYWNVTMCSLLCKRCSILYNKIQLCNCITLLTVLWTSAAFLLRWKLKLYALAIGIERANYKNSVQFKKIIYKYDNWLNLDMSQTSFESGNFVLLICFASWKLKLFAPRTWLSKPIRKSDSFCMLTMVVFRRKLCRSG